MQLWSNVWCHDLRQTESPSHRYSPTSTFRYLDWTNDNTPALATESTWLRFVGFSFCSLHTHRFRCSPRPTELENMKIGDFNSIASPVNIKNRLQQRQQWKKTSWTHLPWYPLLHRSQLIMIQPRKLHIDRIIFRPAIAQQIQFVAAQPINMQIGTVLITNSRPPRIHFVLWRLRPYGQQIVAIITG